MRMRISLTPFPSRTPPLRPPWVKRFKPSVRSDGKRLTPGMTSNHLSFQTERPMRRVALNCGSLMGKTWLSCHASPARIRADGCGG